MYKDNLEVLRAFHPEVASQINRGSGLKMKVQCNESGIPNLYIENDKGIMQPCYSDENPLTGLDNFVDTLNEKKGFANCILGAGLCIQIQAVIDRLNKDNFVILFEAYPEILKNAMHVLDLTSVFKHPSIKIVTGDNVDISGLFASEEAKLFSSRGYSFIEFNKITSLDPVWYEEVKKRIQQFFIKRGEGAKVFENAGDILFINRFKNLFMMNESSPVDVLKNQNQNVPAIIVASGPSLENNIDEIKNTVNAVIIAVDSAVVPLKRRGITPDYIITTDFRDMTYEKLAPVSEDLNESRLVFFSEVTPKIPAYINFKETFYLFLNQETSELFGDILDIRSRAIPDAQSVLHGAIHLAQMMSCNPVIFTGVDLAFSGRKDHVEGTVLNWGNNHTTGDDMIMVEAYDGSLISSIPGFIAQKEICERLIAKRHDIKYIDASEGGIKIEGTEITPLADVILEYCSRKNKSCPIVKDSNIASLPSFQILESLNKISSEARVIKKKLKVYFEANNKLKNFFKSNKDLKSIGRIPEKIKQTIHKMDSINISLNENKIIKSIKELTGKSYSEYLEKTLAEIGAMAIPKELQGFYSDINQQNFVQSIRDESIDTFLKVIDEQIRLFNELEEIQRRVHAESKTQLGEFYYQHGFLCRAKTVFDEITDSPEVYFRLGCISIKKGEIDNGKYYFSLIPNNNLILRNKIKSFIGLILDEWLDENGSAAFKKLMIDRAIKLDLSNVKVIKHQLLEMMINPTCNDNDLSDFICNYCLPVHRTGDAYFILLLAFALLFTGKKEEGLTFMKQSVDMGFESTERRQIISSLNKKNEKFKDCANGAWFKWLVDSAENQGWAKIVIQEIWNCRFTELHGKLINPMVIPSAVENAKRALAEWDIVKHIIPDWYCLASYCDRAEHKNAIAAISKAIEVEKQTSISCKYRGWLHRVMVSHLMLSGNDDDALKLLKDTMDCSFDRGVNHVLLAFLLYRDDKNSEWEKALKEAFICEDIPKWGDYLKKIYKQKKAILLYERLDELLNINSYSAWNAFLGQLMLENGNAKGFYYLKGAIMFDSSRSLAFKSFLVKDLLEKKWMEDENKIQTFITSKAFVTAEAILDVWGLVNESLYLSNYHLLNVMRLRKSGRYDQVENYLKNRLEKESENQELFVLLTRFYLENDDVEEGIEWANLAVQRNPNDAVLWEEIGDSLSRSNDYENALIAYEQCLLSLPDRVDTLVKIGDTYSITGSFQAALLAYETAIVNSPDSVLAKSRFNNLRCKMNN